MLEPKIVSVLTPVVERLDLEVDAVELIPAGKRRLLRIVVDGDGANGHGPTLDDIAEATKAISIALDTADVTGSSPYTLEVTSRGIGRALEQPRHWRRNVGRLVSVTTSAGDKCTGRIVSSTEESVLLNVEGAHRELGYDNVAKAHIQVELNRTLVDVEDN